MIIMIIIMSPSAADARGVHVSIVDETPSLVGRLAMSSLVVLMPSMMVPAEAVGKMNRRSVGT